MTLQLYFRTDALLFFLSFNVFGKMGKLFRQNHRLLARGGGSQRLQAGAGVGKVLPTPATTITPTITVDADRLQLRSQLRLRSPALPTTITTTTTLSAYLG